MSNKFFQFKQFNVFHDKCAMKVTTDSVILGAWTDVNGINYALDIGTGTGLLALMIAQRSDAMIDAVETDESACLQASENVSSSPWKNRIIIIHDTIQHFANLTNKKYDLIISNPPYFQHSLRSPDKRKSVARHNVNLSYDELLMCTQKLMAPEGKFSVIIPAIESENFTELAYIYQLYPSKICQIKSFPNATCLRIMIEFRLSPVKNTSHNELIIHKAIGKYSEEYLTLTKDFYLHFG